MSRKKAKIAEDLSKFVESSEPVTEQDSAVNSADGAGSEKKSKTGWNSSHTCLAVITLMSIAIIVLLIMIASASVKSSVLSSAAETLLQKYPDGILSVRAVAGTDASALKAQLNQTCPPLAADDFLVAQVGTLSSPIQEILILEVPSGKILCRVAPAAPATGTGIAPELLATVNDEPVYASEVTALFNSVPEASRNQETLQQAFDQVLNNKLLLQEAKRAGVTVSDKEIDDAVTNFLAANGLTLQALEAGLASNGGTMQQFRQNVANEVALQKTVVAIVSQVPAASDEEVRAYYEQFKENITSVPSSVTRQILFLANESNAAERVEYVKQVGAMINQTNFCELAKKYSEDAATKDSCGTYSTKVGELLPEYEQAVFASNPGDRKIISTRIGFHIIEVVSLSPARKLSFDEAKGDIASYLSLAKRQKALADYLSSLRQSAKIVDYTKASQK